MTRVDFLLGLLTGCVLSSVCSVLYLFLSGRLRRGRERAAAESTAREEKLALVWARAMVRAYGADAEHTIVNYPLTTLGRRGGDPMVALVASTCARARVLIRNEDEFEQCRFILERERSV